MLANWGAVGKETTDDGDVLITGIYLKLMIVILLLLLVWERELLCCCEVVRFELEDEKRNRVTGSEGRVELTSVFHFAQDYPGCYIRSLWYSIYRQIKVERATLRYLRRCWGCLSEG